jgi:hypothetical protein
VPGVGQGDALAVPDKQRDSKLVFKLLDVPAQRGLRDMETLGSLGDAGLFRDGDECAQVTEIHGRGLYQICMAPGSKMYWTGHPQRRSLCG